MTSEALLLISAGVIAASGLPGLIPAERLGMRPFVAHRLAVALLSCGAAAGLFAAGAVLCGVPGAPLRWAWGLPGAAFAIEVDALSACFLLPVLLISTAGAWFGLEYWPLGETQPRAGSLIVWYALTTAAMMLVVTARNGILFLTAWEVMAISSFFLITIEESLKEVREAGWIYFVATHASTLLLFALFGLIWAAQGSVDLDPIKPGTVPQALQDGIFLVALAAFGIKAGLFPVHVWLPPAHANAPSHVSALMSGVLIKMGVYGIARVLWMAGTPPLWWGETLLAFGVVSGVLGVVFALGQHDLKRLLAYHSVENIGIIFMGLGMAVSGRAVGAWGWMALGLGAALLHTWNHGLFKTLLFLAAGAVLHRTHTREMDRLGGLAKRMPGTALFFLVGAAAICGLPPLNGFVSEWLLYLAMFTGLIHADPSGAVNLGGSLQAAIGIPALALIGGLALACFVKAMSAVFLGEPRTASGAAVRECGAPMLAPMAGLALLCAAIGLAPAAVSLWLDRAIAAWLPATEQFPLAELAPLKPLAGFGTALWLGLGIGLLALSRRSRAGRDRQSAGDTERLRSGQVGLAPNGMAPLGPGPVGAVAADALSVGTWDCGYLLPGPRMQYTAASFAQLLVNLWRWVLIPEVHPRTRGPLTLFPPTGRFGSSVPDIVLDRAILPVLRGLAWTLGWLRLLQRGRVQDYLLYVLIALLTLLLIR
jgi:hydrogenase-4 component B